MVHLGICYGHNATVAVIKDGVLVFCQSEERLNRIKNSTGFPRETLKYVYEHVCSRDEVISATLFEESVFGYLHLKSRNFAPYQYGDYLNATESARKGGLMRRLKQTELGWALNRWRIERREADGVLRQEARAYFCKELGLPDAKVHEIKHHLSHVYSSLSNIDAWGTALIFTLDGVGDWVSSTVSLYKDGKLETLSEDDHRNSLGYYYSTITALLGMKPNEHEFKVMGLAPYSKREYYAPILERLKALLRVDEYGKWRSSVTPAQLRDALEACIKYERFDNVAGAIQELTETLVTKWVHHWIEKTGVNSIALAGGVFMNVKVCQHLASSPKLGKLFVVPSAADESTAIGCAIWGSQTFNPEITVQPLRDLYLGMAFTDDQVQAALEETGATERYSITRPENINKTVAALLSQNIVVARCSGRMEFGARALGNRSILANPSKFENLELINSAIKNRDFWMPFTPSILEEDMYRYIVGHEKIFAPYMSITFDTTAEARVHLKAAIHPRDGTARPQCVLKSWNPDYHELISEFKALTGIGAVLNTSFNLHGEPNVCSPHDAIHTIDNSGLEYLALGSFLLEKKSS
jgi:carbamoyltransferase